MARTKRKADSSSSSSQPNKPNKKKQKTQVPPKKYHQCNTCGLQSRREAVIHYFEMCGCTYCHDHKRQCSNCGKHVCLKHEMWDSENKICFICHVTVDNLS